MGKIKPVSVASSADENDGEWLSTRNKKKISPPPLKMRGGNNLFRRSVPRSPLVLLTEETSVAMTTLKKQTFIADYFSPHLKELPRRAGDQALMSPVLPVKQELALTRCSQDKYAEDEMCADLDMSSPTPFSMPQASPNPHQGDVGESVPFGSQGSTRACRPVDDVLARSSVHVSPVSERTSQASTLCDPAEVNLEGRMTYGKVGEGKLSELLEQSKGKNRHTEKYCSRSGVQQGTRTSQAEQNMDSSCTIKTGSGASPLHEDRHRKQRNEGQTGAEASLRRRNEGNNIHRLSSPLESGGSHEDGLCESLQTPLFLKEAHHTLDFSQLSAVDTTALETSVVKNTARLVARGMLRETAEINNTHSKFPDFTEMNSPLFTSGDDPTQDHIQFADLAARSSRHFSDNSDPRQWCSAKLTSHTAADTTADSPVPMMMPSSEDEPVSQEASHSCDGERSDSLQTPEFLSSEGELRTSQQTGEESLGGIVPVGSPGVVDGTTFDDLHTPSFLKGNSDDNSSVDMC